MADKQLILTLGKVVAAVAWADGDLSAAEIEQVKDVVFHLAQNRPEQAEPISGEDWARLEMYIAAPVSAAERQRLAEELQLLLRHPDEVATAVAALQDIIQADGVIAPDESEAVAAIRQLLESPQSSRLGQLLRQLSRPAAPNREEAFADYLKNQLFYAVRHRLNLSESDVPESTWRKLCLAGAMLAQIAHTDQQVHAGEREAIAHALRQHWGISPQEAELVAEIAISQAAHDVDYYRAAREFFNHTLPAERLTFLDALFSVAAADGDIAAEESATIRHIARSLQIRQSSYIQAQQRAEARL